MRISPLIPAIYFTLLAASCTKTEISRTTPLPGPTIYSPPPVAIAEGTDTAFLPLQNYITVSGYKSFDPTKSLKYLWRQISGPTILQEGDPSGIDNYYKVQLPGTYQFELTVTDILGRDAKDSVTSVAVFESICSQQRSLFQPFIREVTKTPESVSEGSVVGYGGRYILFTQGFERDPSDPDGYTIINSENVHLYNTITGEWKIAKLSENRIPERINSSEDYIVFSGGQSASSNSSTRIDIFHIATEKWSYVDMPEGRNGISVGIIKHKLVVAGGSDGFGVNSKRIDVYDIQNQSWQVFDLSEPRSSMTVINDGQRLYFGGGANGFSGINVLYSNKIDVYDPVSGRWSVDVLSEPKGSMLGTALNNKIYWAGGQMSNKPVARVEIKDAMNNTTTFDCLGEVGFTDNSGLMAFQNDNQSIGFVKQGLLSIYEPASRKWSAADLPIQTPKAIMQFNRKKFIVDQRYEGIRVRYHVFELQF